MGGVRCEFLAGAEGCADTLTWSYSQTKAYLFHAGLLCRLEAVSPKTGVEMHAARLLTAAGSRHWIPSLHRVLLCIDLS